MSSSTVFIILRLFWHVKQRAHYVKGSLDYNILTFCYDFPLFIYTVEASFDNYPTIGYHILRFHQHTTPRMVTVITDICRFSMSETRKNVKEIASIS